MRVFEDELISPAIFEGLIESSEKIAVIAVLDPENEVVAKVHHKTAAGTIGTDNVVGENKIDMRVLLMTLREKPPAGLKSAWVITGGFHQRQTTCQRGG